MSYPQAIQFDDAIREGLRQGLGFELAATRGRSMWREPRPAKQPRFRFRVRAARA